MVIYRYIWTDSTLEYADLRSKARGRRRLYMIWIDLATDLTSSCPVGWLKPWKR